MTLREELGEAGHVLRPGALDQGQLALLANLLPASHAARNLLWERAGLRVALESLGLDAVAAEALGAPAIPVNVVLLDKTAGANWKVPGHQDLVMPVEREIDEPGFHGWTTKQGVVHVEPPVAVLEKMVALRIHLDDCPASNGALAVVPGSHRRGKLRDTELTQLPREAFVPCEAAAGDVLLMRPLLVHRSSPAEAPAHRRVLHVVYASDQPGEKVRWKVWSGQ
jgi:Phytanoyl-CoA dioxygenase (PhyH)